jgi:hypothetical protein
MGSKKQRIVALFNLIGFGQFFPASISLANPETLEISVLINIVGTSFLPAAGILNLIEEYRFRFDKFTWQISLLFSVLNLLADICYPIASILSWPGFNYPPDISIWLFRIGQIFYIAECCLRVYNLTRKPFDKDHYEVAWLLINVCWQYIVGLFFFLVGGLFVQLEIGFYVEMFLMGSSLLLSGAVLDLIVSFFT